MSPTCMSTVVFALALSCMPLGMAMTRLNAPEDTIVFGGDETKDVTHKKGKKVTKVDKVRPGSAKTMVCDGKDCVGCTDYDKCWHGGGGEGGTSWLVGPLVLKKMKGREVKKSYVVEVYAACPTGGTWSLYVHVLTRGNLVIYTDFEKSGHMKIWKEVSKEYLEKNGKEIMLPSSVKETRVRVAFNPTSSKKTSAYIMIKAKGVNPGVDRCMTAKGCLKILTGPNAYALRNNNRMQLDCLGGDAGRFKRLPKGVGGICREWDKCVSEDGAFKEALVVFLRAGVGKGRSLNQAAVAANDTAAAKDPNTCVDPAADDAESWDCECLHDMKKKCEKGDDDLEECLRARMCKFDAVCDHWKKENDCPKAMIQEESTDASSKIMRRQTSTKSSAHIAIDSELDGTMQGKCASQ